MSTQTTDIEIVEDYRSDPRSFRIVSGSGHPDFTVGFTPKKNQPYYLVLVNYDTGDSFKQSPNHRAFVDLYQTYEAAKQTVKDIEYHYEHHEEYDCNFTEDLVPSQLSVILTSDSGKKYKHSCDWCGYFEKMNYVKIVIVELV